MSRTEKLFCRSAPWRGFARRVVLPWALQRKTLTGDVLELGGGSGAMAAELLATNPAITMCVTDVDPDMVATAASHLAGYGDRATARQADATALGFDDASFDAVLSWIMLHHTVRWETALAEAVRVLRPGGLLIGYDLANAGPMRWLHGTGSTGHRVIRIDELRAEFANLPLDDVSVRRGLAGVVMRFSARRAQP